MYMIIPNTILLGVITFIYLFYSIIAIIIGFLIRLILSRHSHLENKFIVFVKKLWLSFTVTVLAFYFTIPTYIYYDKAILSKKKCIVISNHLTNYDWVYILIILNRLGMYEDLIIILKEGLKNIPIFGYGMKMFGYIFLKREWNTDREILETGIKSLFNKERFYLLLFPEGTFIDKETHPKSRAFCDKNKIVVDNEVFNPNCVLLPRKTGFEMIFNTLKPQIEGIIDITLLTTPYKPYPSENFTLYEVFIKRSKKLNLSAHIKFLDLNQRKDENWIYEIFKSKETFFNKYKENDGYKNIGEFSKMIEEIDKTEPDVYKYETLFFWSKLSPFFVLMGILLLIGIFYLSFNKIFA